jgi:hypothetical protein
MAESEQVEKNISEGGRPARSSDSAVATRVGATAGEAAGGYQRARLDPRGLSPSAFFALQRTAGNHAVNSLLRGFAERQSRSEDSVSVQRDPPATSGGGGGSAGGPAPTGGGSSGGAGGQPAQLQLPPPAPQQVPADQIAAADPAADPAGAQPDSAGSGGGGGGGAADPDTGEVDLVRTTTNGRTGEHTIDFTANFHLPEFHLPAFSVLGRQVQPFDDPSVFVQLSFDPSGLGGGGGGGAPSYSQIHSTLVGVSTSALNAHIFSLHGREFFDIALPVSLGVQNDATGMSANAQAGVQAAVNVTRALSITATVNGQATIPFGGGPASFSFAGVSVGVGGKF